MKDDTDIQTPEASPPAASDSPSGGEPAFISRARRILGGDIRPEDYLVVPEAIRSAVAEEEARLNETFGVNQCSEYVARVRNDWTLQYLYGAETIACRCTQDGVIIFAVGLKEIRTLLDHFTSPEHRSGFFITTEPLWQSLDLSDSPSHSPQPLPHSV